MNHFSSAVCQAIVEDTPWVRVAHNDAVLGVKDEHKAKLKEIAGFLYLDGFLHAMNRAVHARAGRRAKKQEIQDRAAAAVDSLRSAGILPAMPTFMSVAWFVFKWVIYPYIVRLLSNYSEQR